MAMMHNPPHPGEILANYVTGHTVGEVAEHLGVTRTALSRVLNGRASISAEMAVRIGKVFDTDPGLWIRMQGQYDLWRASRQRIKAYPFQEAGNAGPIARKVAAHRNSPLRFENARTATLAARSTHTAAARAVGTIR